jgi:S1-C subfamily serine protease
MNQVLASIVAGIALIFSLDPTAAAPLVVDAQSQDVPTLAPMLKKVLPSVVGIAIDWSGSGPEEERNPAHAEIRRFFNVPDRPTESGIYAAASGVVIDANKGLIITNNHIVEHTAKIIVTLTDGQQLQGKLVGGDRDTDIALIKVPAEGLTEIPFGDSGKVEVGDFVVAIGNPFGTERNITTGIVGARHRSVLGSGGHQQFIQTDAAISPANSGGALVDLRGRLVGINTAITTTSNHNIGAGFAIPSNVVHDVADQLANYGEVRRR